jgi:hypothetical protein
VSDNFLPSGSILPSGLLDMDSGMVSRMKAFNQMYQNYGLKSGIVIKVYEIDDDENLSGLVPEYDCAVFEQTDDSGQNSIVYKNCISTDLFGGVSDFLEFRYRPQTKVDGAGNSPGASRTVELQDGSYVLLNCLNGSGYKALIVGGLTHPKRTSGLTPENGLTLLGQFNGLSFGIDLNGALTIGFQGATNNDGTPVDTTVGGTYMKIEKDGSLELSDATGETIRLDKTAQTATVASTKDMSLTAGGKLNQTSTDDTNQSMKAWMLQASGSATLQVQSFSLTSQAAISVNGSNMKMNATGQYNITAQAIVLNGICQLGGLGGLPAPTLLTLYQGIGNLGLPVISMAISGFSSKVFIAN